MSRHEKNIQAMRDNPRDWTIEQLEAIASHAALTIGKNGVSHVIFQKAGCPFELSVPARKPIKPVYITKFLEILDWMAK